MKKEEHKTEEEIDNWEIVQLAAKILIHNPFLFRMTRLASARGRIQTLLEEEIGSKVLKQEVPKLIREARNFIHAQSTESFEDELSIALASRQELLEQVRDAGDRKEELRILQDIATLQGLYHAKKQGASQKKYSQIKYDDLTDDQLERIIAGEDPLTVAAEKREGGGA